MVKILDAIPTYPAPAGGALRDAMLADYRAAGVLILEDFVPVGACERLRARALELVDAFDPQTVRHVFSTTKQTQLDDSYFYQSGDKIRFFLEDDAFDDGGNPKFIGLLCKQLIKIFSAGCKLSRYNGNLGVSSIRDTENARMMERLGALTNKVRKKDIRIRRLHEPREN